MPMNESGMAMVSAAALFLVLKFVKYTQVTGYGKTCEIRIRLDLRIPPMEPPNSVIGGKFAELKTAKCLQKSKVKIEMG